MRAAMLTMAFAFSLTCVQAGEEEEKRIKAATETLSEIMQTGDKAVPQELFNKASCAVVVPGMKKGGFIFAGKYDGGSPPAGAVSAVGGRPLPCVSRAAVSDCK